MQTASRKKTQVDYDFTQQVGHLMRRAYQRHVAIFQQVVPDERLTGAQFSVLCALHDNGTCSLSDLGKATAIDQATVRGIIERLKARALVSTAMDTIDRRKVMVSLTPEGEALLLETIPAARQISELTVANLNPAERLALEYLLRKLADGPEEATEAAGAEGPAAPPTPRRTRAGARPAARRAPARG